MTEETDTKNLKTMRKRSIVEKASQNFFLQSEKLKRMLTKEETPTKAKASPRFESMSPRIQYEEDLNVEEIVDGEKTRYERTGCFSPKVLIQALQDDGQLHGNYFEYESVKNEITLQREKLIGAALKNHTLKFNHSAVKQLNFDMTKK
eukprot:gene12899-7318_t